MAYFSSAPSRCISHHLYPSSAFHPTYARTEKADGDIAPSLLPCDRQTPSTYLESRKLPGISTHIRERCKRQRGGREISAAHGAQRHGAVVEACKFRPETSEGVRAHLLRARDGGALANSGILGAALREIKGDGFGARESARDPWPER